MCNICIYFFISPQWDHYYLCRMLQRAYKKRDKSDYKIDKISYFLYIMDRAECLEQVKINGFNILSMDTEYKDDREIVIEAVKQNGKVLKYLKKKFKEDRAIVLEAVKTYSDILQILDKKFSKDKEIVIAAIRCDGRSHRRSSAIHYIYEDMLDDKDVALVAIKYGGMSFTHLTESQINDKDIALEIVKMDGEDLIYLNNKNRDDEDICLEALGQTSKAFDYISSRLEKDRSFILKAIKKNYLVGNHIDKSILNDEKFVLEAVKRNGKFLNCVSSGLCNNKEIVLSAVKNDGFVLLNIYELGYFGQDKDIAFAAIRDSCQIMRYLDHNLQNDEKFMVSLIKKYNVSADIMKCMKLPSTGYYLCKYLLKLFKRFPQIRYLVQYYGLKIDKSEIKYILQYSDINVFCLYE